MTSKVMKQYSAFTDEELKIAQDTMLTTAIALAPAQREKIMVLISEIRAVEYEQTIREIG